MRIFFPILLTAAAIGLFVVYTNPTYTSLKGLQAKAASYDEALNTSQELRAVRDQLLSKRNTFRADLIQKLERLLPDNVDNIRLIIDINNIAARHNLTLTNVQLGDIGGDAGAGARATGASGGKIGSAEVGFSAVATYEEMVAFLADLEGSLRLIDVEKISFHPSGTGTDTYTFTIRTYWLH